MDFFNVNRLAWLDTIAWAEGADYYTLVYGGTRNDAGKRYGTAAHPAENGWAGEKRRDDGRLTTAAGRYQFVLSTWKRMKGKIRSVLGYVNFTPQAQDTAAILLTEQDGGLGLVDAGRGGAAGKKLGGTWEGFKNKSEAEIQRYFEKSRDARLAGKIMSDPYYTTGVEAASYSPTRSRDSSKPIDTEFRKILVFTVAGILMIVGVMMVSNGYSLRK